MSSHSTVPHAGQISRIQIDIRVVVAFTCGVALFVALHRLLESHMSSWQVDGISAGVAVLLCAVPAWWQARRHARMVALHASVRDQLEEERHLLRSLIDAIPDSIYVKDAQSRFVVVNEYLIRLAGQQSAEDLLGKTDLDFFPKELASAYLADEQAIIRTHRALVNHEEASMDAAGQPRWLLTTKVPLFNKEQQAVGIMGIGKDITERRKAEAAREHAEAALRQAHHQTELFLNAVPSFLIGLDTGGRITRWNSAATDVFKLPESRVCNRLLSDCGIEWRGIDIDAAIASCLAVERVEYADDIRFERNGKQRFLQITIVRVNDADQTLAGFLIFGADMTERRILEAQLRQTEEKYRYYFEENAIGILKSTPDGRCLDSNPALARILGYDSPEEIIATLNDLGRQLYVDGARRQELLGMLREQSQIEGFEFRAYRKDGSKVWLRANLRAMRDEEGNVSHYIGAVDDITERKLLEEQLRQAQKLEAIGQLAAGIAHEINTPTQFVGDNIAFLSESWSNISGLLSEAAKMRKEAEPGPVRPETLAEFDHACQEADLDYMLTEAPRALAQSAEGVVRVATIVRAMKDFSHPGGDEKQMVDLNHAIEVTATVARNEWKYVADLETRFARDLPLVPCLVGEFNQVMLNLIVNAAQAIGEVTRGTAAKGRIEITTRLNGDNAEVKVQDTGAGIPDSIRSRIFEPFFTTKEVGKGTGQGLALAHAIIVKKHGGAIWFESEVGKGTTFFVTLPLPRE